jgi:ubiquinone/menaquinone biosynthesis C-methylase UbiE
MGFNLWYFIRPPWDSGISPPELLDFIKTNKPGNAFDIGCGTGTNIVTLAQHGWRVTGIDFAPRAISIARRKIKQSGFSADVQVADVTRLTGIDGLFDFILDLGCFPGLSSADQEKYLALLDRVCASSCYWLLYGFFKPAPGSVGPGLTPIAIDRICSSFSLVSRSDGVDKRERPSAYFLFRKN